MEKKRRLDELQAIMDGLDKRYLFAECAPKPQGLYDRKLFELLRLSGKSMIEAVSDVQVAQKEYREYIEQWVHEIKTPITAARLVCRNTDSDTRRKLSQKLAQIDAHVERALFYAKAENPKKDFIIRKTALSEICEGAIQVHKTLLIQNGNGHQFLIILPDEVCVTRPVLRFAVAAMTAYSITVEQYNALSSSLYEQTVNEWDYLYSKAILLHSTAAWSAISVFPLFYLALTLALTAATVLTVQQLSEAGRYRRQFELLCTLGMDRREMMRTLFRQLAIYYLMSVIPPVLIAIPFILDMCNGVEPGTLVGVNSPSVILMVSLGLFFLVYLVYTVVAYISMKRNAIPE